ncbi:SDR family oxidoreductase [Parapedobacter indicus]|uniref:NAD(P)-dependent dehydrogenase, short-chain alcohol dehydrogenase family n=1 Tax=Parapedobacter indicus TaxID=1477437 RepID=A0A1I3NFX9_9SPHI|nr:SDR family oxidoreductase [Parapedobacter indicus]PPL00975.1 NAD(P)-dependent dehydrogenase (short-subunit alcohol dehydrogenase family) [Parapedobacter indicus]SFJ08174.1 NAD(P)-dependent dehydrogenase, short-chain alcohol dehydrogenase family [Parapedobacter indicus]
MKKIILITGSSRGIGAATALLAAKEGYAVAVNYYADKTAADAIVSRIVESGGSAVAIQADISQPDDIVRLFSETDRLLGRLDALVNNAGILERQMRLIDMDAARLSRIFMANVIGQFLCAQEAIKRMSTKHGGNGGSIVNVSSLAARTGSPNEYLDYAASKGALDTFTLGLSKEVAGEGIRVNAVRPAFIYTDIHAAGGEPNRVERLKDSIPMQRGGSAEEVAEAILWLVSEKSSYTTGSFIEISGGK